MEVGEKGQRLRALVAFEEGPDLVPITHIGSKPSLILVLGNPTPFFDPPPIGSKHTCGTQRQILIN